MKKKGSVWLALLPPFVAGVCLRTAHLGGQVLWSDELLSLRAAVRYDALGILTHFGPSDYGIPLALLNRFLLQSVGLSELAHRLPALLFGIASLVVFAIFVVQAYGARAGALFAWLLAVSPLHIVFTRTARPYTISLFLCFVGTFAAYRLWESRAAWWSWIYVSCAVLAPWFHLSALAAALAPLAYLAADWSLRRKLAIPSLVILSGLVLLLFPPTWFDFPSLGQKAGRAPLEWRMIPDALALLLGVPRAHPMLLVLALGTTLWGMREARRRGRPGTLLLGVAAAQLLFTLLARPVGMDDAIVFARFNLFGLATLLVCAALGIESMANTVARMLRQRSSTILGMLGAIPVTAQLALIGPAYLAPGSYLSWDLAGRLNAAPEASLLLREKGTPEFYRTLARLPSGSAPIVEVPWYRAGPIPHSERQHTHRQPVIVGLIGALSDLSPPGHAALSLDGPVRYDDGVNQVLGSFANFVHVADSAGLRRRGVKYVIFHPDLEHELAPGTMPAGEVPELRPWIQLYHDRYGEPVNQDANLVVFDVSLLSIDRKGE